MRRLFDSRFAYTALLWLLLPYAFFHLCWRARKQPEYLEHIGERFGRYAVRSDQPVIWLHTVSVGETRAAATLVQRLRERYPHHQLLLTHTTPTGRAASEQLYGDEVIRVYLPYDYPFAVRNFLRPFPAAGRRAAGNRGVVQPHPPMPCHASAPATAQCASVGKVRFALCGLPETHPQRTARTAPHRRTNRG